MRVCGYIAQIADESSHCKNLPNNRMKADRCLRSVVDSGRAREVMGLVSCQRRSGG